MNATSQHTLIAVFRDRTAAQAAVDDLKSNGFTASDIYGADTAATTGRTETASHHHQGGIVGWFKSIFGDEDNTDYSTYENAVQSGNFAVRVQVESAESDRAVQILNDHSPVDVQDRNAQDRDTRTNQSTDQYKTATAATGRGRDVRAGATESIPVIREELQVGKRMIQRGGVRVYVRTVEEPVTENVQLREEKVRVERTPVNRQATGAELQPGKEQVFEVQEFREEPVISKQARVVEEVRIGKEATERTDTIRETVRHTEVNVENLTESRTGASAARTSGVGGAVTGPPATSESTYNAGYERTGTGTVANTGYDAGYDTKYDNDPAYQYGVTASSDPRYAGRSYDDVENDLRTDYNTRYPDNTWDNAKASVRRGWDKVSAKAHSA